MLDEEKPPLGSFGGKSMKSKKPRIKQFEKKSSALEYYLISVASLVAFFGIWQLLVELEIVSNRVLASPSQVAVTFAYKLTSAGIDGATLGEHFIASFLLALTGFVLAASIGVMLGLTMGWFKKFDTIINPFFEILRPIPPIAWIPLSILWFGVKLPAKAFIIFLSAFVPSVINSYTGIKQTKPVLIQAARTFGASNVQIFFKVGIPSALTMVFTGLKVSLGASWMALVAAELLASTVGLGYMIQMARNFGRPDIIIVGMLTIGATGALLAIGLDKLEKKVNTGRQI